MRNLLIINFLIFSSAAFSQCILNIEITGIRSSQGNIMLQLMDENEKIISQEMKPAGVKTCSFSIKDLKPGKYALRYYHDENSNMKMETNLFGKPLEGYGFSNNVIGKFGPPSFDKWLFEIREDKRLLLKITY